MKGLMDPVGKRKEAEPSTLEQEPNHRLVSRNVRQHYCDWATSKIAKICQNGY